jgi:hypothetical protein
MLTDDECLEMWQTKGELFDTIRLIYKTGYDDGQMDIQIENTKLDGTLNGK